jgi:Signal transduction histidine kinase
MKLADKINLRFLSVLLIVFTVAGVILYFVLGVLVNQNIDDILKSRSRKIEQMLHSSAQFRSVSITSDQAVRIDKIAPAQPCKLLSDTTVFDRTEHESVEYRKLTVVTKVNHHFYRIQIMLSRFETEDMVATIFYFMLGLFGCSVITLFFLNRWVFASVWKPFYETLHQLKRFKIGQHNDISFKATNVSEFTRLNGTLTEMIQEIETDYQNLKEFTENASHEIQTPVAVIKSKLEYVLQDNALPKQHSEQIQSAYQSITRLSKLNDALLLLSKIENRQFPDVSEIDFCELVRRRLEFIEELVDYKNISIVSDIQTPVVFRMNPYLAEILVNNILGNAVKHNLKGGEIVIASSPQQLVISNTGKPLTVAPEKLFQRFSKHNAGNESTGLGLAIAAEICEKSQLTLTYKYHSGYHNLVISGH